MFLSLLRSYPKPVSKDSQIYIAVKTLTGLNGQRPPSLGQSHGQWHPDGPSSFQSNIRLLPCHQDEESCLRKSRIAFSCHGSQECHPHSHQYTSAQSRDWARCRHPLCITKGGKDYLMDLQSKEASAFLLLWPKRRSVMTSNAFPSTNPRISSCSHPTVSKWFEIILATTKDQEQSGTQIICYTGLNNTFMFLNSIGSYHNKHLVDLICC